MPYQGPVSVEHAQTSSRTARLASTRPRAPATRSRATGYALNAFGAETYGALGDNAKNLIRDLVQEASANSRPTTNLYNWSASKFAESVKQLVSISLRRGIATQLRKAALARRNLEPPPAPTLNAHLAAAFNAPSDHPFTDAPSARPTPPTRQPTAASTSPPCMIPQPAIPPPTSITYDPTTSARSVC